MNTEKYVASDGYYHYIYKITFSTTSQYYIGQHSVLSNDFDKDEYMGSGKELNECYELSGYNDAIKEICCYVETFEELDELEKEYIGNKWKTDRLCLNMIPGGRSAGKHDSRVLGGINAQKKNRETGFRPWTSWWNSLSELQKKDYKETHPIPVNFKCDWSGRKHKPETIEKMKGPKPSIYGSKNGNFGKHWCYNEKLNISVSEYELLWWDLIATGWIAKRKINFSDESLHRLSVNGKKFAGSKCITNGKEDKYIKEGDQIPEGFKFGSKRKGKKMIFKTYSMQKRNEKKNLKKQEMYLKLKPMLEVYENEGFDAVVQKFNYKHTRNNLVQSFKAYIPYPEYIPNKHTRKTKVKEEVSSNSQT